MKRPRCFIAMAFGNKDTDVIFNKYLKPIIRKCGFSPRRVDRVLHNDYIDRKIIDEIENADICIADLTYARQSVYFEAGYAQRKIPVLYTCRKDHFSNTEEDKRVHFDLRQRNIVDWKNEKDINFPKKFERRFNHLAKPIIEAYRDNKRKEKERKHFSSLSVQERMIRITGELGKIINRSLFKYKNYYSYRYKQSQLERKYWDKDTFYYKKIKSDLIIFLLNPFLTVNRKNTLFVYDEIVKNENDILSVVPKHSLREVKNIRYIGVVYILNSVNYNTIQSVLHDFSNPCISNHYKKDVFKTIQLSKKRALNAHTEFVFLDAIKSISELRQNFIETLKAIKILV
ncbi:MAG: hypothetical protein NT096_13820 [Proteobacteria bacterium]|nr:hypothetical protein [Pseudomonadota bacterium]